MKSQIVLLSVHSNLVYNLIIMRHGHKCSLPHLIISLYNQLAQYLKIGDLECTGSNPVCDFDTIWAVAAAIIVQLDALLLSCTLDIVQLQKCDCVMLMAFNKIIITDLENYCADMLIHVHMYIYWHALVMHVAVYMHYSVMSGCITVYWRYWCISSSRITTQPRHP